MTRPFYDGVMVLMVPWVTTNRPICQAPNCQTTTNLLCVYSARLDLDSSGGHLYSSMRKPQLTTTLTDPPLTSPQQTRSNPTQTVARLDHSKKNIYTIYPIHINKITWSICKKEAIFFLFANYPADLITMVAEVKKIHDLSKTDIVKRKKFS